jgi:hypothetical protein
MAKTLEQRKAALEQRIAALRERAKRIDRTKSAQDRRDRAHVGIVVGWGMIEHALNKPVSEVQSVVVEVIKKHLADHPEDRAVADLLAMLDSQAAVVQVVAKAAE